ncbi:hypothetical protein Ae201684P_014776 [Aphanomyces euteiches]|nr:hypothetical protein Ae201684P_014776 [Aphanomyces euteiches]
METEPVADDEVLDYKTTVAQLLEQLNGVMKRGTRVQVARAHNKLGMQYILGDEHELAIEQFEKELDIRKELNEPVSQESCFNNIGSMYFKMRRFDQAVAWFHEALALATARNNTRAMNLVQINLALAFQHMHNYSQAMHFASGVVDSPEGAHRASALSILASSSHSLNNTSKAIEHATNALQVAEEIQDIALIKCCVNNLAMYSFQARDFSKASLLYERCLSMASDPRAQAVARYHLGAVATEMGHSASAEEHLTIAIELANSCGDAAIVAMAKTCLGVHRFYQQNALEAHSCLFEALQTARVAAKPAIEGAAAAGLGCISVIESRYDEAAAFHESDLALATASNDKYSQVRAHGNLGVNYLLSGDCSHALSHFRTNLTMATTLGDKKEQARAYFGMGTAAAEMQRRGIRRRASPALPPAEKACNRSRAMIRLNEKSGAYEKALADCDHFVAAAEAVGDTSLMLESYRTMANVLSAQLLLLKKRGGSRFHDTINLLIQKRDNVCAKYKDINSRMSHKPELLRRQEVDRVVAMFD